MREVGMDLSMMSMESSAPGPSREVERSPSPGIAEPSEILKMLTDPNHIFAPTSPKSQFERLLCMEDNGHFPGSFQMDMPFATLRNTSKTLKCPKCNWHYKYPETLEIHMKEKHSEADVKCVYCVENRQHPKLARGESYSCGYKPYRCEICKYSTTTKGNLSIHMQSDKHLHAMQQELPSNFQCAPVSRCSPIQENDSTFVCLICAFYTTESLEEMMEHADKDRSRPSHGDISMCNGSFRCFLCPYNTSLKANFQLHTRTDKHLQKVQMANHIREGSTGNQVFYRLNNTKNSVQVLCRPCQEIFPSSSSLRDHCESPSHRSKLKQGIVQYTCRVCTFQTLNSQEAHEHMACHEPTTWPKDIDFEMADDSAAYACTTCGFTTKDAATLEEHAKSHEGGEPCPLCTEKTTSLTEHLISEHKIAESAVERLLAVHRPSSNGSDPGFSHRCDRCTMVFKSESALTTHTLIHLFSKTHKCPICEVNFNFASELKNHINDEHSGMGNDEQKCDLCMDTFTSKQALFAHFNTAKHLQMAKQHLEKQSTAISEKQFSCNVCAANFPLAHNLETHLRSVAHQARMSRLADLVAAGELDQTKQFIERPGDVTQPTIRDLVSKDSDEGMERQLSIMEMMSMFMPNNFPQPEGKESIEDVEPSTSNVPKIGAQLLAQIQFFGEEKLTSAVPELKNQLNRVGSLSNSAAHELTKITCSHCGETIFGLLAMNMHSEEKHGGGISDASLKSFGTGLLNALKDHNGNGPTNSRKSTSPDTDGAPPEKKQRPAGPTEGQKADLSQLAMLSMMQGFPFMQPGALPGFPPMPPHPEMFNAAFMNNAAAAAAMAANSPAKRARTRITDEQLKILRQYFDINNSPTEMQIKEMSLKAGLPEKVIKHWFRNTLFKERQRDKDSPYNFNVPPQMSIDLDAYEKTGEAKVVALNNEIKEEPKTAEIERKESIPSGPPSLQPMNLQAMLSQMQANPFTFMESSNFLSAGPMTNQVQPPSTSSTGRRANRTRFTDYQLRTLQQFFDKQAYPKDDDLEILSKKLQLSPRVIVVWFQNARQKARKIYENQPNNESTDRFVRTPGSNFQCKRCNQVFQRYYELIQHQQKKCYKDDGLALAQDNKGVEETLTDEEKAALLAATVDIAKLQANDLLKLLATSKGNTTDVLLKMCENANNGPQTGAAASLFAMAATTSSNNQFHKRCPICSVTFHDKVVMVEHLHTKHPQQMILTPIDVEQLPNMEAAYEALDLSGGTSSGYDRDSLSTSPNGGHTNSDDDVITEALDDHLGGSGFSHFSILNNSGNSNESRCSPANNKRYRTHLTPSQVYVMKSIFAEYKTPSMTECECLGKEIGLHKRVVQVWFQNARAKERKSRPAGAPEEDKSKATRCPSCDTDCGNRISMQDHLFSKEHIQKLKTLVKSEPVDVDRIKTPLTANSQMIPNGFPFNLMNFPMIDMNIFGTPIPMLHIPDEVKTTIVSEIGSGEESTTFTQDGGNEDTLKASIPEDEKQFVTMVCKEVGWACPSCTNVFQEETKLKDHQRNITICQSCDKKFVLIQYHYGCTACSAQFGIQTEFIAHLSSSQHEQKKKEQ